MVPHARELQRRAPPDRGAVRGLLRTSIRKIRSPEWSIPRGDLATDQRHRVRFFASYDVPILPRRPGALSFGLVQAYDTGTPYGAGGLAIVSPPYVTDPGYQTPPKTSVTYYFTSRDAFRTWTTSRARTSP